MTRLRLVASNPEEVFGDIGTCDNGLWQTGPIVIDNTPSVGPAVIEERESTTVIGPGGKVSVDRYLSLICDLP